MGNAYFWPLLIGFLSIISASDLSAQSPSTTAPPPLLAASTPPSVYFLTQGVWLTIRDKTYGFGTGTQVELVEDSGGDSLRVKAGDFKFDVKRGLVTNDVEVAKLAWRTEVEKIKEADQEKAREQEQVDQAVKRREEREAAAREQAAQQAAQWQAYQEQQERRAGLQRQQMYEDQWLRTLRNTLVIRGLGERDEIEDLRNQANQAQINAQQEQEADRQIRELHQKYNIPGPDRTSSGRPAQQELNELKDQLRSQQEFKQWKRQAELPLRGIDAVNNPFSNGP